MKAADRSRPRGLDTVQTASYMRRPSTVAGPCKSGRWRAGVRWFRQVAPVLVLMSLAAIAGPVLAEGFSHKGVTLPNGSVKIGEDRFRLPDGYEATLKWLKNAYKAEKFPRKFIVNQPGIKGIHIVNPSTTDEWEGFNLYEYQGEVRLYVLVRRKAASNVGASPG